MTPHLGGGPRPVSAVSAGRPALRARVGAPGPRVSRHWQVSGHIRGLRPQRVRAEPCARAQSGSLHCGPLLCAARGWETWAGAGSDGPARPSRLVAQQRPAISLRRWCPPAGTAACCSSPWRRTSAPPPRSERQDERAAHVLHARRLWRCAAEAERFWAPGSIWSLSLACAGHRMPPAFVRSRGSGMQSPFRTPCWSSTRPMGRLRARSTN